MLGAGIDAQFRILLARQRAFLWQHALHGKLHDPLWEPAAHDRIRCCFLDTARITGVAVIGFLLELIAREDSLVRIDHDNMVSAINVGRIVYTVLATQAFCNKRCKPTDNHAFGIDDDPFVFDFGGFRRIGFHCSHGLEPFFEEELNMIERAALMPWKTLVNVTFAISATIFVSGCGNAPETEPGEISSTLVWQTSALEGDISGVSIIDKFPPVMAVAYASGGVDIIDFDGTRQNERGPIRLSNMSEGFASNIDGVALDLFPGIDERENTLKMVAVGEGLIAPVDLDVETTFTSAVEGICTSAAADETSLMQIGLWTDDAPGALRTGSVFTREGGFVIDAIRAVETGERYISALATLGEVYAVAGPSGLTLFVGEDSTVLDVPSIPTHVSLFQQDDSERVIAVMTLSNGELWLGDSDGRRAKLSLIGGIGIDIPDEVGLSMVMTGNGFGGFPNGLIAIESLKQDAPVRIQFIELGDVLAKFLALPSA